ncbi:MAG: tryptophan-rich sensory protein [Oscillospiraceae bacterium]|nr:tryptophan-rich sensory protein [Oscillospiraceae bacterium]
MKLRTWKPYLLWILLAEAVGGLSGWLSREGIQLYNETVIQPPLSPSMWVFPVVWGILYALMGIGAARISMMPSSAERSRGLNLFVIQLALNFCWSLIFFNLQAFSIAFFWLLCLLAIVLWMFFTFKQIDPLAANLQIPYLLWLSFAAYLNAGVWYLNK